MQRATNFEFYIETVERNPSPFGTAGQPLLHSGFVHRGSSLKFPPASTQKRLQRLARIRMNKLVFHLLEFLRRDALAR